jgi:hypothetical protein
MYVLHHHAGSPEKRDIKLGKDLDHVHAEKQ